MPKSVREPLPLEIAMRLHEDGVFGLEDLRHALVTELRTVCPGCRARPVRPKRKLVEVRLDFEALVKLGEAGEWDAVEALIRAKQPRRQSHPDLAGRLAEKARDALPGAPEMSDRWAWAAGLVATGKESHDHRGRVAQALAFRANAARIAFEFDRAEGFLAETRAVLGEAGTHEAVVMGDVDYIEGLLRRQRRQFGPAVQLFQRAAGLYARTSAWRLTARALNSLALSGSYAQQHSVALQIGRVAFEVAKAAEAPDILPYCRLNLAWYQFLNHDHGAAQATADSLRTTLLMNTEPVLRCRLQWLEARLAVVAGRHEDARQLFWRAYQGFASTKAPYEAVQVALSLAGMEASLGQAARLQDVARALVELELVGCATLLRATARAALEVVRKKLAENDFSPCRAQQLEREFLFSQLDPEYRFAA